MEKKLERNVWSGHSCPLPLLLTFSNENGPRSRDLIEAGYEPGPRFKEMLAAVEDAQVVWSGHSCPLPLPLLVRRQWSMYGESFRCKLDNKWN